MKPQKSRDVKKFIKSIGWVKLRKGNNGSHEWWGLSDESIKHSIPFGNDEISAGVLNQLKAKGVELPKNWR